MRLLTKLLHDLTEYEHLIEAEECEISKLKIELHHLETQPERDESFISYVLLELLPLLCVKFLLLVVFK